MARGQFTRRQKDIARVLRDKRTIQRLKIKRGTFKK